MNFSKGTVYWFTGLSGAGKTTLGKNFYNRLRSIKPNVIFLDGDLLREVFNNDLGHSLDNRKIAAGRYSRLCKMMSDQGIDVVCSTISMFREVWSWNRSHIANYKEIYIRVAMEELIRRDQKQLYSRAIKGEVKEVMGIDLAVDEPTHPDFVFDNSKNQPVDYCINQIWEGLNVS